LAQAVTSGEKREEETRKGEQKGGCFLQNLSISKANKQKDHFFCRVARIGIEHGDRPEHIAANFAKIYDLDDQARDHLATVIRKSVEVGAQRRSTLHVGQISFPSTLGGQLCMLGRSMNRKLCSSGKLGR
jgi:hypothetical protein